MKFASNSLILELSFCFVTVLLFPMISFNFSGPEISDSDLSKLQRENRQLENEENKGVFSF